MSSHIKALMRRERNRWRSRIERSKISQNGGRNFQTPVKERDISALLFLRLVCAPKRNSHTNQNAAKFLKQNPLWPKRGHHGAAAPRFFIFHLSKVKENYVKTLTSSVGQEKSFCRALEGHFCPVQARLRANALPPLSPCFHNIFCPKHPRDPARHPQALQDQPHTSLHSG